MIYQTLSDLNAYLNRHICINPGYDFPDTSREKDMRVHIWQQFSSNHSADFVVVGVFERAAAAHLAAAEVRRIMILIQEWYQNPENAEIVAALNFNTDLEPFSPTPIEIEIGKQYGFEWETQAPDSDWYFLSSDVTKAIVVIDNNVIVENYLTGERTRAGAGPMTQLLKSLGGQSFPYDPIEGEDFKIQLSCIAPDKSVANEICETYRAALNRNEEARSKARILYLLSDDRCDAPICEDLRLSFQFHRSHLLAEELPELLAYFRDKGCTDIRYGFERIGSSK